MANKVELQFLTNAQNMMGELRSMNAYLHNIQTNLDQMNTKAVAGHQKHASALKGLALRFVGYNLILNQVMGAQQKLMDYVTEGVSKFREFETRIAEVATIMTGDFEPALRMMETGIVNLSLTYGKGTSDLTKGLYDIMSAAFSAKDALNLLNTSTKAAIAGLSDVRTSVDIFTTVLNTYGMSVYEATHVSDVLFQSVVRGKFQFAELESALGYVVPIAAQAGIEFDELMAALSTATRHGLHLDMASRGLAMALQNIINPSEGAAKAAKKYGVEMSGLALRIKGIAGVFQDMQDATKNYGKIVLNELIPNIRSLRVAMVLAGEEGMEGLLDDMDRLSVVAGRTEEAFQKIADTSQFASNQITQQWEKTQREVGESWDKLALAIQQGITTIVSDWKSFLPIVGPIFTAIDYTKEMKQIEKLHKAEEKYLGIERKPMSSPGVKSRIEELKAEKKAIMESSDTNIFDRYERAADVQKEINELEKERITYTKQKSMDESDWIESYLGLQEEMSSTAEQIGSELRAGNVGMAEELNQYLLGLTTMSGTIGEHFNEAFGEPIIGGIRNLESMKLLLEEIEFSIIELEEHLEKPIQYGWGKMGGTIKGSLNMQKAQLVAEQDLSDTKYDVKMGLIDENYQYKVLNKEMQDAIAIVREHDAATKADTESINLMNVALRKIQIEMLELQLVGMMRRRGLSRQEERRMKKLEIAAAKLRLENMKNTKAETASEYIAYEQAKELIEKHIAAKEHESYMLKYNYDQQLEDLQLTIDYEEDLLKDREKNWEETSANIVTEAGKIITYLEGLSPKIVAGLEKYLEFDVEKTLEDLKGISGGAQPSQAQAAIEFLERATQAPVVGGNFNWILKRLKGYQRGTEYVPETGLALIHRGERIGAAGKEEHGGTQIGTVVIQVKELADIGSPEKLAALLSVAKDSQILSKTGKTHYRLR